MYVQVSAMLRSRQAESGVSGPGPDLQAPASSSLDSVLQCRLCCTPCLALPRPPPVCVRSVQNISRARPVRLTPGCLSSQAGLSLWARLACLLSLWLPGRARHGQRLIRLRPVPPLIYRARHHRQQLNPSLNIPNSKLPILS